jgi:hypothetical protein
MEPDQKEEVREPAGGWGFAATVLPGAEAGEWAEEWGEALEPDQA